MYVTFLLPQKTRFSQIKKSQAFRKILGSYKKDYDAVYIKFLKYREA